MKLDPTQDKIINKLCKKYDLEREQVIKIIHSPFTFIRNTISKIELNGDETEKEFNKKTKNFNLPSIAKVYSNYYNFKKINNGRNKKGEGD